MGKRLERHLALVSPNVRFLVSSLWFDVIWVSAVVGQERWQWGCWLLVAVTWSYTLWHHRGRHVGLLLSMSVIAAMGIGLDWFNIQFGVFVFTVSGFPSWLMALWCGFSWYLLWLLPVGAKWSPAFWIMFGALGGVVSYWCGARLGAVSLPLGVKESSLILAVEWAFLFGVMRLWWRRWEKDIIHC